MTPCLRSALYINILKKILITYCQQIFILHKKQWKNVCIAEWLHSYQAESLLVTLNIHEDFQLKLGSAALAQPPCGCRYQRDNPFLSTQIKTRALPKQHWQQFFFLFKYHPNSQGRFHNNDLFFFFSANIDWCFSYAATDCKCLSLLPLYFFYNGQWWSTTVFLARKPIP